MYINTSLVIGSAFLVGVLVAVITQKENLGLHKLTIFIIGSILIAICIGLFLVNMKRRMLNILQTIKSLEQQ